MLYLLDSLIYVTFLLPFRVSGWVMVFSATFNNSSVILLRSVLLACSIYHSHVIRKGFPQITHAAWYRYKGRKWEI